MNQPFSGIYSRHWVPNNLSPSLLGDKLWIGNVAYVVDENEKIVQWKPPNSHSTLTQQRKRRLENPVANVPRSAVSKKQKPNTSHFNFLFDSGSGRTGSSSSASSGASASSVTTSSSSTRNSSSFQVDDSTMVPDPTPSGTA